MRKESGAQRIGNATATEGYGKVLTDWCDTRQIENKEGRHAGSTHCVRHDQTWT